MNFSAEKRTLVACMGNIFLGDDGFGCAVAPVLLAIGVPEHAVVVDFGIRGLDLAYALHEPFETVILVDAVARGGEPGTVYVLRPEEDDGDHAQTVPFDAHSMKPRHLLAMARTTGAITAEIYIVGCEPADLGDELEGRMGLSQVVAAAVPDAARTVLNLIDRVCRRQAGKDDHVLAKE